MEEVEAEGLEHGLGLFLDMTEAVEEVEEVSQDIRTPL